MTESWQPIVLSAKVFGHLSQGLYRTPAGAIKELISNSFDADATLVRIHTGFPRFETFSCEDDGVGMSREEFSRLMNHGIGSSYKRISADAVTPVHSRPLIGRLGLGILSLAQICTRFEIVSHHKDTKTAFRATIKFPPYTRQEMDRLAKRSLKGESEEDVHGGQYQVAEEPYDPARQGLRIFTKYLRESFRKRMRALDRFGNKLVFQIGDPYKTFQGYLDAVYSKKDLTKSLNLRSDYDQLLFGLALAAPLPYIQDGNIALQVPTMRDRQARQSAFEFRVQVDNLLLANPVCLPSDREGHDAKQCRLTGAQTRAFKLLDGPFQESCNVVQHTIAVENSDFQLRVYEVHYANDNVAGSPLAFDGYFFQQTGRIYPRDIQGVLVRLNNVAIGKYDNSMLVYPYAEGPRYSMVSAEVFVQRGFEDALNIDRDSFNELHPHYMRLQAYVHGLLHDQIFPQTWDEEKDRNRTRRDQAAIARESSFVDRYRKATGDRVRSIERIEKRPRTDAPPAATESPVEFRPHRGQIEVDRTHPLLQPLFRHRKYAPLVEKLVLAFERANREHTTPKRRELFYRLLNEIFSDL